MNVLLMQNFPGGFCFNSEDSLICHYKGWDKLISFVPITVSLTQLRGSLDLLVHDQTQSDICSFLLPCSAGLRGLFSLISPLLSVLWAVCCGAVTSLSPRCHPAGAGFRLIWPLPKPQRATSAIHKRQPLSLSYSLAHTASDSHTPPFHSQSLSHPLTFYFNFLILCIPLLVHSSDCVLPPPLVLFMVNISLLFPYLTLPPCPFSLLPFLYPHPTEKFLTHYIFKESQGNAVAVKRADPNNTKSPAFTSDDNVC